MESSGGPGTAIATKEIAATRMIQLRRRFRNRSKIMAGSPMLKRIYIHNYRTFVNFEWRPPTACVLVGRNGVGKSALLEVFALVQDLVVEGKHVEDLGFPSTLTVWRNEFEQVLELDAETDGDDFHYRLVCRTKNGSNTINEELTSNGDVLYRSGRDGVEIFGDEVNTEPRTKIPFVAKTSFLSLLESRHDNQRIIRFRNYVSSIWCLKPDPLRLGGSAVAEAQRLDRDLKNFASWYRTRVQEDPDAATCLRGDLQHVFEGFEQIRLQTISADTKDLSVRFRFGKNSHELNWAKLSDGQRMLIALYGVFRFAFSKAKLVILDEVEKFVAPAEIQPWLREVVDLLVANNHQLIVISHHSESINYLAADSVWQMWRDSDSGHTRIEKLQPDRETGESAYEATKAEAVHA
jgi:predicted ATPase